MNAGGRDGQAVRAPGSRRPQAQPSLLSPATRAMPTPRCPDGNAAVGHEADLDAYVAKMVDGAPPLTSEQRDLLALLLRGQRPQ
jgi:hypothetical protein